MSAVAFKQDLPRIAHRTAAAQQVTILYATETGNAEYVAGDLAAAASRSGLSPTMLNMADVTPDALCGTRMILIVASTYGDGEPPMQADAFFAALNDADAPSFAGSTYAVLALGDRAYPTFCGFGKWLDKRFSELGGRRLRTLTECDFDFSEVATAWIDSTLPMVDGSPQNDTPATAADGATIAFLPAPGHEGRFEAAIAERIPLHTDTFGPLTVHLRLNMSGDAPVYFPGDAISFKPRNDPATVERLLSAARCAPTAAQVEELFANFDICTLSASTVEAFDQLGLGRSAGHRLKQRKTLDIADFLRAQGVPLSFEQLASLLRPLAPRSYSIASSRSVAPGRLDLLVTRAWSPHEDGPRMGVASSDLVHRRPAGNALDWTYKPNRQFRLPEDPDRPIVMIGPGTGVAPFRGFLQEREASGASGRNWLVFGHRKAATDFFFRDEILGWQAGGLLSRLDLAFSRDQQAKRYVHHLLWEARDELLGWLGDGAVLYVCGALAMGAAIDETLSAIFAEAGQDAAAALTLLKHERRYLKDVY